MNLLLKTVTLTISGVLAAGMITAAATVDTPTQNTTFTVNLQQPTQILQA